MIDAKASTRSAANAAIARAAIGLFTAILLVGVMIVAAPKMAQATPQYAKETGLPCAQCHVSAAGGKDLKPFGKTFKDNGFKVPKKK